MYIYCGIGEALRRLSVQVKILLDITSGMKKTSSNVLTPVQSPGSFSSVAVCSPSVSKGRKLQEEMTEALDMSSVLVQAVDKTQSEMAKVLRVRTEQTVRLGLNDFLSYFALNRLFVNECEAVSGQSGVVLKGVMGDQIHDFIPLLHEVQKQKLVQKMKFEKWERIDFKPQDALILAHIVQSMTTDPPAWLDYTDASIAWKQVTVIYRIIAPLWSLPVLLSKARNAQNLRSSGRRSLRSSIRQHLRFAAYSNTLSS